MSWRTSKCVRRRSTSTSPPGPPNSSSGVMAGRRGAGTEVHIRTARSSGIWWRSAMAATLGDVARVRLVERSRVLLDDDILGNTQQERKLWLYCGPVTPVWELGMCNGLWTRGGSRRRRRRVGPGRGRIGGGRGSPGCWREGGRHRRVGRLRGLWPRGFLVVQVVFGSNSILQCMC